MDPEGAVAIVGVACRYPGCETLEEFWRILVNGENHIREVTPDRWNVEAFFDPNFETPGKTYAKWAGLIDNAFEWDNTVFNVNELEAEVMDPQQKLALEVSFKALENAGIPLQALRGSNAAVYMCQMNADYANQVATDIASWSNYEFTGTSLSILANRISYAFDLRGPSVSLDTACSGSMVAVHLGAHSILSGESTVALCGGSNFIIGPSTFIALSKSRMASPTGQCRAFSADADGYVKAEGCGVVVLKNLRQALSDGDRVWGIIKTSIGSDGHAESPITNPSKLQLQSLITNACSKARIDPEIIQYVECHGTGTAAGDPTEAWGVGTVIGKRKQNKGLPPIPIGSVKTNIGHLESAAGTAGLLKVLLMMKHGKLVPSLHCERLNPKIDFEKLHVRVGKKVCDMGYADDLKEQRVVSINSNGFGGTAVHSIVQQEKRMVEPAIPEHGERDLPFLFTAATKKALKMSILDTCDALMSDKITSLYQLSYTSTLKRTHFLMRYITFAKSLDGLLRNLELVKHKESIGQRSLEKDINTIFVFCGMGSHWNKMGEKLYEDDETFRSTIDEIQQLLVSLDPHLSILNCFKGMHDLSDPFYGQPAIFSIQVGLFKMFMAKKIKPDVILGHSVGEVAASCCAGYLTLQQAVRLIFFRAKVLQKVTGGGMLVVGKLQVEKVADLMLHSSSTLDMAAQNSPTSCTLSGEKEAINELQNEILKHYGEGVFLRKLDVKVAYHSKFMDQISEEFEGRLKNLQPNVNADQILLISTVNGQEIRPHDICSARYWYQNLRQGVRFSEAFTRALSVHNHNTIVEIGPKPVLRSYIKELASKYQYTHMASMMERAETNQINQTMCSCLELQAYISWEKYYPGGCPVGDFPRYIFQRKYLYKEPENAMSWRKGNLSQNDAYGGFNKDIIHPFVAKEKSASSDVSRYVVNFTSSTTPFVFEHKLDEVVLVPGGCYPEIALAVVSNIQGFLYTNSFTLEVDFLRPLIVAEGAKEKEAMVTVFTRNLNDVILHEFDVTTGEVIHASGLVAVKGLQQGNNETFLIESIQKKCTKTFDQKQLYECLSQLNFTYGKSLRWIQNGYKNKKEVLFEVHIPEDVNLKETTVHPVFIDTLFQMFALLTTKGKGNQMIPQKLGTFTLLEHQKYIKWAYVKVKSRNESQILLDGFLLSESGRVVICCRGMTVSEMGHDSAMIPLDNMFQMSWKSINELPKAAAMNNAGKHIALFVDDRTDLESKISKWKNYSVHVVRRSKDVVLNITSGNIPKCVPVEFGMLDCILYGWSLNGGLTESDSGNEIASKIGNVCLDILNVLKSLQALPTSIPIYILVSGCYTLQKSSCVANDLALNGCMASSVIGMMRTVTWEVPLQDYLVIDIDQISDLNLLQDVISNSDNLSAEIAISDNTLHLCNFMPVSPEIEKTSKISMTSSSKKVDLVRASEERDKYMLELHEDSEQTCTTNTSDKMKELVLEYVFMDNTRAFPSHLGSLNAVAYDAITKDYEGKRYLVCCPIKITTAKLYIPVTRCIPLSSFPSSLPTLSFWAMAWNICNTSNIGHEKVSWTVVGSYKNHPLCEAIRLLAKFLTNSSEVEQELAHTVIVYVGEIEEFTDIMRRTSNCKVMYIITKTPSLCGIIQSKLDERHRLQHVISVEEIFSFSMNYLMGPFRNWVANQDSERMEQILEKFNKKLIKMTSRMDISRIRDLGLHDYVLLDLHVQSSQLPVGMTQNTLFKKDGAYLIIGGSKGLGFALVQHIASNGAGRIGILSRTGIQPEHWQILQNIKAQHQCKFVEIKADVTNEKELQEKFRKFSSSSRFPLKGVFFGAVVLHDCTIRNMTEDMFNKVLKPKIAGAWNIFTLCKGMELDYFLLHSSIISMCGNVGQSNYAAANAFLDGLALYARKMMRTGQSICWGALDLGLLENNKATQMKLASHGMIPIKRNDILRCFDHALLYNPCVAGYSKFVFPTLTKEIKKLPLATQKIYWWVPYRKGHYVKDSSLATSQMRTAGGSIDYLKKLVHAITMMDEEDLDVATSLEHLGADSHQIITIYSNLIKDFGKVPNLSVVEMPMKSLAEIAGMLENGTSESKNVANNGQSEVQELKSKYEDPSDRVSKKYDSKKTEKESYDEKIILAKRETATAHQAGVIRNDTAGRMEINDKEMQQNGIYHPNSTGLEKLAIGEVEAHQVDVTKELMKQGDHFVIDINLNKAKISVWESQKIFNLKVETAQATSSYDLRSLVTAEIKQVTVKAETLYCLHLDWLNGKTTTMYSNNVSLLKGWEEGLVKLKQRTKSAVMGVNEKSSTCVIL